MKSEKNKRLYVYSLMFLIVTYSLISLVVYAISLSSGNEGITISLFGGGDDGFFYWSQVQNILGGREWVGTSIHSWVISIAVRIISINDPIIARILNLLGFIGLVSILLLLLKYLYKTEDTLTQNVIDLNQTRGLLICFLLFYMSLIMNVNLSINRDVWIYLFYILSVYYSSKLLHSKSFQIYNVILLILALFLLGQYRGYAVFSILIGILLYWFYMKRKKNTKRFVIISLILFGIYYTFFININLPIVNMSLNDALSYRLSGLTTYSGGSQMNINLSNSNYIMFLFNYIRSYFGNFIGPFVWDVNSIGTLIVFLSESIPMISILFFLYKNRKLMTAEQKYTFFQSLIWIAFISISNDNVGTASRLRVNTWLLIITIFCLVYFKARQLNKQTKK